MTGIRDFLIQELEKRKQKNTSYSLRSFARHLDLSPSYLSMIIKGQKEISESVALIIADKLNVNSETRTQWIQFIQSTTSHLFHKGKIAYYKPLSLEQFKPIRDWYNYALLELINTKNFQPSVQWVSNALKLPVNTIQRAVDQLVTQRYLLITEQGWKNISGSNTSIIPVTNNEDRVVQQRQILDQAKEVLETVPKHLRDQSSMTMSIQVSKLEEAREKIKQFRRELCAFLEDGRAGDEVYTLSISLFPVTEINKSDVSEVNVGLHSTKPEIIQKTNNKSVDCQFDKSDFGQFEVIDAGKK